MLSLRLVSGLSSSYPRFILPYFLLLICYYSCVFYFLLFHPCCSDARSILCEIHDGIPVHCSFPVECTEYPKRCTYATTYIRTVRPGSTLSKPPCGVLFGVWHLHVTPSTETNTATHEQTFITEVHRSCESYEKNNSNWPEIVLFSHTDEVVEWSSMDCCLQRFNVWIRHKISNGFKCQREQNYNNIIIMN